MPIRDPKTGKPLSGAALARRKKAQVTTQRKAEAKRKKTAGSAGLEFSALPPPPLGDSLAAMAWWNDVLLTCADQVLRDPVLTLEQRVKYLADFSAKAGLIRDKSAEARALREALKGKAKAAEAAGLERAGSAPPTIPRPAG